MKLRKTLTALLVLAAGLGACSKSGNQAKAQTSPAAGPSTPIATLRFPDQYKGWYRDLACMGGRPYFRCDYTSQTCVRGIDLNIPSDPPPGYFVGVLLGSDRQTVLAHFMQQGMYTTNFDTGEVSSPDIPRANLSRMDLRHNKDGQTVGFNLAPDLPQPPYAKAHCGDVQPPE